MRKLPHCALLIVVALLVTACGMDFHSGPTERKWSEDVLLEDGSTIQVDREVKFNETNSLGGGTYNAVEIYSIIKFTGDMASLPPWNEPLLALLLYRELTSGEWVVVATTTSCVVWQDRGEPPSLYWEFHLTPQGWMERPLSNSSIGKSSNLFQQYQPPLPSSHITVADRLRVEADPRISKRYQSILAAPKNYCTRRTPVGGTPATSSPPSSQ